ncbi:TPA: hypothetical protein ACIAKG_004822, partial [Enterobacter roggenkampii]
VCPADLDINIHTFARGGRGQSVVCTTVEGLTHYHYIPSGLHYYLLWYYDPTAAGLRSRTR